MPEAMLAAHPAAADLQVVDQERQRHLVELVGEELVGEPAGEGHQVVGGDGAGDGDAHRSVLGQVADDASGSRETTRPRARPVGAREPDVPRRVRAWLASVA